MNLMHIELSKLIVSPANMRAKRKDRDFGNLVPSVRARGVLVPLLVRPNGEPDVYEIVAGRRRFFAAKQVAEEGGSSAPLPCGVMEQGDDASALEASLLENIARLDADEVSQWETFVCLVKLGRNVDDIAGTFGLDEKVVRRVLALGNLLPRIRALYRNEQIEVATVRQLTMATSVQQREWLKLLDSPDEYAPTGRVLKEWLFGGLAVPTTMALFDLGEYTALIATDLFGDTRYFSDIALFWSLQYKAIEERKQAYLADGWAEVVLLEDGRWFDRWAYEKRSKAKGGRVYIVLGDQGAVEFHEGYLPRKEAKRLDQVESPRPPAIRPELSAPLTRYVDLHRHALVRSRLLDDSTLALQLMLTHAIAGSSLWTVKVEKQRAEKPETEASVRDSRSEATFGVRRVAMLDRLGQSSDTPTLVDVPFRRPLEEVFGVIARLDDFELLELVTIVMGETLDAGGAMIDTVGTLLKVDSGELWEADDAFYALLRDRAVLRALVADVAGEDVALGNADASGKVLKAILRDCLTGQHGRDKVTGWSPRWLRFPAGSYLGAESAQPDRQKQALSIAVGMEPAEFEPAQAAE